MALNRVAGWLSLLAIISGRGRFSSGASPAGKRVPPRQALLVMLISGTSGFYLGMSCDWQIAVESAQALAGFVPYPADNPFYMYHVKSWTLLHQIPAVLLACGVSERWLSLLLAGLIGAVSFQAIALCGFVLSRDRMLSCVLPLACEVTNACRDLESVHQIRLLPEQHWSTYGVAGVGYVLYSWALLAAGFRRTGALLVGLGPAVHPTLGAWGLLVASLGLCRRWRREPLALRREGVALAAGAALAALSFSIQLYLARHLPGTDSDLARRLVKAFAQGWDNHRVVVALFHPVMIAVGCSLALSHAWLRFDGILESHAEILLRCLAISAVLSLPLAVSTHFQDWLPLPYLMAMPGRFNDLIAVAFPALTLGLLARYRENSLMRCVLSLAIVYLLIKTVMMTTHQIYISPTVRVFPVVALSLLLAARELTAAGRDARGSAAFWNCVRGLSLAGLGAAALACRVDRRTIAAIVTIALALYYFSSTHQRWQAAAAGLDSRDRLKWALRLLDAACLLAIASIVIDVWLAGTLLVAALALTYQEWLPAVQSFVPLLKKPAIGRAAIASLAVASAVFGGAAFFDQAVSGLAKLHNWQDDRLFAALAEGDGSVLTAGRIPLVQLRTRRPVVLYGAALNQITYVPASAPKINELLRNIYDEDLLRPRPPGWVACGGLLPESAKEVWISRSLAEWQELGERYGFTDILTGADWKLKLPRTASDRRHAVFHIPRPTAYLAEGTVEEHHSLARLSSKSDSTTAETSLPSVGE